MKTAIVFLICLLLARGSRAQEAGNVFIITTDGFRWQEVFSGADSILINDPAYVKDTALLRQFFWHADPVERRKKLMPFFWTVIADQGQLYGNRNFSNKVNVKNLYKISYPGYSELLTGYADPVPVFNTPTYNRYTSVLEHLNRQPEFQGKVAAFSSWNIFPFILNAEANRIRINSGYQQLEGRDTGSMLINRVQDSILHKTNTRHDLLTYMAAREYIQRHHPRVVFLGFGQTDDFAHQGQYDMYLQQAGNFDRMIAELWYYVQTDPFYKDNTTFIITTDHGRGSKPSRWSKHNVFTKGSGEIWLALIGQAIEPMGEIKKRQKIYQNQLAATIASLLGEQFLPRHPVAAAMPVPSLVPRNITASRNAARSNALSGASEEVKTAFE
ncbi:MAG TPA: hypothetical protein VFR58_06340 [Flavisolibacter sp.]|nr:hypothetical protein [Flavisolibacter sp.]